ncbi:MAG: zinc ribbon-containing protein [Colwellia sp.]|nr:zinc ribbon-containing protein [Colwellia sp.]MCW8866015.1 zinc ribbon-containing protein [Colwellia sp.]MCW9081654.1 zinc ribbon-containing protein [Colwellia sp.]
MIEKKEYLMEVYQNLNAWLNEAKEIQKPKINELLKQAKLYGKALGTMSEEKLSQFTDNLRHDLHDFYQQNQSQAKHSIYLGLLNESLWANLAQLTDKSQVEWSELVDDFEHDGIYHTGDVIGFGELVCQQCQETITVMHTSEVGLCAKCGGEDFTRLPLNP